MAPLSDELVAHKQNKLDTAAVAAIKAHDAHSQMLPEQAKLNANDKTVIAKDPDRFDFTIWSGLPHAWIIECFGAEVARILIEDKFIDLDPHPVDERPVLQFSDFDVLIAEAAGFHRAINLWNKTCGFPTFDLSPEVKGALSAQATLLGGLLRNRQIDIHVPSTFPGKFKGQSAESGNPYRLIRADDEDVNEALTLSYYYVFMDMV